MNPGKYFVVAGYAATRTFRNGLRPNFLISSTVFGILPASEFGTSSGRPQQSSQDLYDVLGVEKTASAKDIKAAYYELSKKYHPDVAGNQETADARRFHQITEAYETLGNEEKRRTYDDEHKRSSKIYDAGDTYSDPDLATLRELQRKWELRRRHYAHSQAQRVRSDFEMKHDKEEFESFYKRYRENVAKSRQWDENVTTRRASDASRQEHYTEFQKQMLRRQYEKQMEYTATGYTFTLVLVVTLVVLLAVGQV